MLQVEYTAQFKRDIKKSKRRGKLIDKLTTVMELIEYEKTIPLHYKDHVLKGNYAGCRECHIEPDWLLIYKIITREKVVIFARTGSHSDLFK
jgi:mRNA interferase YafQ